MQKTIPNNVTNVGVNEIARILIAYSDFFYFHYKEDHFN